MLRTRVASVVLALALVVGSTAPASAGAGREFGRGLAVIGTNLFYMPAKVLYATGGALVAGVAWVFSGGDSDVSRPIADASLRGDYAISTRHLDGKDRLEFIGRNDDQRRAEKQANWGEEQAAWDKTAQPTNDGF